MSKDDIKPGEQLTLAQINRLRKQAQLAPQGGNGGGVADGSGKPKPEAGETDPHTMNVPELKDWLTEQGIEYEAGAKKADLQALIPEPKPEAGEAETNED
ncbi:HeH/LEM domain-containing protein [Pelagibacterium sp.]|uniref:HeH/LEM domain-containing protein n=1 Tax=Pelagibacterium sp. TaxID=1967288 RepID=UPI003A8E283A